MNQERLGDELVKGLCMKPERLDDESERVLCLELKKLSDEALNLDLLKMVSQERKLTCEILNYLKEVEERKLFAKRGYPSLFAYCTTFLGYSESAAHRRISSMRLLKEAPQMEEKISSGELSLSNVAKAASFFQQEKKLNQKVYTSEEKIEVLENLVGKTQKQADVELIKINPLPYQNVDRERIVTEDLTELKFTIDKPTLEKLKRLRELKPGLNTQELIHWMLSRCLKQVDPLYKKTKKKSSPIDPIQTTARSVAVLEKSLPLRKCQKPKPMRKTLRRSMRHQVWTRAEACCQFQDQQRDNSCRSRIGLEIDHVQPLSLGGDDRIENLRLLCREHHKLMTAISFGTSI